VRGTRIIFVIGVKTWNGSILDFAHHFQLVFLSRKFIRNLVGILKKEVIFVSAHVWSWTATIGLKVVVIEYSATLYDYG